MQGPDSRFDRKVRDEIFSQLRFGPDRLHIICKPYNVYVIDKEDYQGYLAIVELKENPDVLYSFITEDSRIGNALFNAAINGSVVEVIGENILTHSYFNLQNIPNAYAPKLVQYWDGFQE